MQAPATREALSAEAHRIEAALDRFRAWRNQRAQEEAALIAQLTAHRKLTAQGVAKARRQTITEAVHGGDVDEVAKLHHDLLKVLVLGLLSGALLAGGCAEPTPRLIIVNQPMAPVRLIHEGTPGWWLSDALYEATLLKLDELKERNDE